MPLNTIRKHKWQICFIQSSIWSTLQRIPCHNSELKHAALVLSTEAHARIISIDPSSALAVEGVLAYVDAKVTSGLVSLIWFTLHVNPAHHNDSIL